MDFYAREASTKPQVVDDAFCAFVWSVVVQQPGVCIGTVPEGAHCEVHIAPQVSAKRKGKAKEGEDPEGNTNVGSLVVIPDAAVRPLDDLKREYGDGLRIAVDPKTSFQAITGSHIRVINYSIMYEPLLTCATACEIDTHGIFMFATRLSRARSRNQCRGPKQENWLRRENLPLSCREAR